MIMMIIKIMMAYESFVMVDKSVVSLIVFQGTKIDEQILKCFANKTSRKLSRIWSKCFMHIFVSLPACSKDILYWNLNTFATLTIQLFSPNNRHKWQSWPAAEIWVHWILIAGKTVAELELNIVTIHVQQIEKCFPKIQSK